MKKTIVVLSIAALGTIAAPAQAKHDTRDSNRYDRIEKRMDNQRHRIRNGVRSGELTRKEAKRLRKQQRKIARLERRFMRDGFLDRREYREINSRLDTASNRIYRLKHNDRYSDNRHNHDRHSYNRHSYNRHNHDRHSYNRYSNNRNYH